MKKKNKKKKKEKKKKKKKKDGGFLFGDGKTRWLGYSGSCCCFTPINPSINIRRCAWDSGGGVGEAWGKKKTGAFYCRWAGDLWITWIETTPPSKNSKRTKSNFTVFLTLRRGVSDKTPSLTKRAEFSGEKNIIQQEREREKERHSSIWKLIIIALDSLSLWAPVHRHQNSLVMTVESPTVIWQDTVKMIHNNGNGVRTMPSRGSRVPFLFSSTPFLVSSLI